MEWWGAWNLKLIHSIHMTDILHCISAGHVPCGLRAAAGTAVRNDKKLWSGWTVPSSPQCVLETTETLASCLIWFRLTEMLSQTHVLLQTVVLCDLSCKSASRRDAAVLKATELMCLLPTMLTNWPVNQRARKSSVILKSLFKDPGRILK